MPHSPFSSCSFFCQSPDLVNNGRQHEPVWRSDLSPHLTQVGDALQSEGRIALLGLHLSNETRVSAYPIVTSVTKFACPRSQSDSCQGRENNRMKMN